jgi:raffinose/stachyose/melibiose transport system substrate-binding protein
MRIPLRRGSVCVAAGTLALAACGEGTDPRDDSGDGATLIIESWRNDDLTIWEDDILPAFHEQHPDIEISFEPTAPDDYNATLESKLEGGTAGDLITCRPFDVSLGQYEDGHLEEVSDFEGMDAFDETARSAWVTDDGAELYCVPMASVIHGFMYNTEVFDELGLDEPATTEEFHDLLDDVADDGTYRPMVLGTAEQWEAATMGFQNIGPNYWDGEAGRAALIEGEERLDDPHYVEVFEELASWSDYLPPGYESMTNSDSQNLFTLGEGAVFPAGSWEIALFNEQADFEIGAFPPPLPAGQDTCHISDHTDIGIGMNAATEHPDEARTFLEWVASPEFSEIYANELPGFFPLADHEVQLEDPLAQEILSWREECEPTIRNTYQILSRGEPNLENEMWDLSAQVLNGTVEPDEAAQRAQESLEAWYEPQQ